MFWLNILLYRYTTQWDGSYQNWLHIAWYICLSNYNVWFRIVTMIQNPLTWLHIAWYVCVSNYSVWFFIVTTTQNPLTWLHMPWYICLSNYSAWFCTVTMKEYPLTWLHIAWYVCLSTLKRLALYCHNDTKSFNLPLYTQLSYDSANDCCFKLLLPPITLIIANISVIVSTTTINIYFILCCFCY